MFSIGGRHSYLALHEGTDAAPTAFSASTRALSAVLYKPWSYPLCNTASHHPDSSPLNSVPNSGAVSLPTQPDHSPDASPPHSTSAGSTVSRQASIIPGLPSLPDPTTPGEIGDMLGAPAATSPALLVHTSPHPTNVSPPDAITAALKDIPTNPTSTLPYPLEGSTQRDIAAPCAEQDISEVSFTASTPTLTPTLVPAPASAPPVMSKSSASYDGGAAPTSNSLLPVSSAVGFSIPTSLSQSRDLPLLNSEFLLSSTAPSHPTGNATAPRLCSCGLNTGGMCSVKAVLQLLVPSSPFWDLFRELDDLKGQRGAGSLETGGCATPLVDATVRFFEEFES